VIEERLVCIDPGVPGGYLFVTGELGGQSKMEFTSCTGVPTEMAAVVERTRPQLAVIEKVHCGLMSKVANWRLGFNFGVWQGIFAGKGIPVLLVTPQCWQKQFRVTGEDRGWIQKRGKNQPVVTEPVNIKDVVWRLLKEKQPELFVDKKYVNNRSHRSDTFGILSWYRNQRADSC